MDAATRVDLLEFRIDDVRVWDGGVSGDVQMYVDNERIASDYFPGRMGFELTYTLCSLFENVEKLERGEDAFPYPFACGSCVEPGCTQISWKMTKHDDIVTIRMRGYQKDIGDGDYRITFATLVASVETLFADFISAMEDEHVETFDYPQSEYHDATSLAAFEAMKDTLSEMRSKHER